MLQVEHFLEMAFDPVYVRNDSCLLKKGAFDAFSRRIANSARSSTQYYYWSMPKLLKPAQNNDPNQASNMQTVCGRIKAQIEFDRLFQPFQNFFRSKSVN